MASNWLIPTITLVYFFLMVGQKVSSMRLLVLKALVDGDFIFGPAINTDHATSTSQTSPERVIDCEIKQPDDQDPESGSIYLAGRNHRGT